MCFSHIVGLEGVPVPPALDCGTETWGLGLLLGGSLPLGVGRLQLSGGVKLGPRGSCRGCGETARALLCVLGNAASPPLGSVSPSVDSQPGPGVAPCPGPALQPAGDLARHLCSQFSSSPAPPRLPCSPQQASVCRFWWLYLQRTFSPHYFTPSRCPCQPRPLVPHLGAD